MSRMEEEETETVVIDPTKLSPLSPEVFSKQCGETAGTIGHVVHRKSAVLKAISGVMIVRFKDELARNLTIKLGYANAKCVGCYRLYHFDKEDRSPREHPGAAVTDAALLSIAGNESCLQPQISEHLIAVEIMKLQNIILLNKVDFIKEAQALGHQKGIIAFVKGAHRGGGTAHRPISAQLKYNIDAVNEYIVKRIPIPVRDFTSPLRLIVVHSFDANKPSAEVDGLMGGVAGRSILTGVLMLGRHIEIHPGIVRRTSRAATAAARYSAALSCCSRRTASCCSRCPAGSSAWGDMIDPTLCRSDKFVGQAFGMVGKLPQIYIELEISLFLLWCLLGVKTEGRRRRR
ncbi:hypothetical protein DFH11DRAFT_1736925 [Phellopilus nigrolimitatus]|nr:hypothetical protein DFH11DRAFT_1736925 [Phellopilus nigrolimitatus]